MQLASENVKRVALELGGKSPNVILEDADLSPAVPAGVAACYLNSGQTCSALTPHDRPALSAGRGRGARHHHGRDAATPGDPFDSETRLGPLVSATQRERVRGYIKKGIDEGAKLLTGGAEAPEGLEKGYYVRPTVFSDVTHRHDDRPGGDLRAGALDHSLRHRGRGRSASPTTPSTGSPAGSGRATRLTPQDVARRLRTGQVELNGGGFNPMAPFGGYKQSGIGRELGRYGLEEYLEVKSLQL